MDSVRHNSATQIGKCQQREASKQQQQEEQKSDLPQLKSEAAEPTKAAEPFTPIEAKFWKANEQESILTGVKPSDKGQIKSRRKSVDKSAKLNEPKSTLPEEKAIKSGELRQRRQSAKEAEMKITRNEGEEKPAAEVRPRRQSIDKGAKEVDALKQNEEKPSKVAEGKPNRQASSKTVKASVDKSVRLPVKQETPPKLASQPADLSSPKQTPWWLTVEALTPTKIKVSKPAAASPESKPADLLAAMAAQTFMAATASADAKAKETKAMHLQQTKMENSPKSLKSERWVTGKPENPVNSDEKSAKTEESGNTVEAEMPRSRGRPPKKVQEKPTTEANFIKDELSEPPPPELKTEEPPQQRGRGRPPKQKPLEPQPAAAPLLPQLYDEFEDEIMK